MCPQLRENNRPIIVRHFMKIVRSKPRRSLSFNRQAVVRQFSKIVRSALWPFFQLLVWIHRIPFIRQSVFMADSLPGRPKFIRAALRSEFALTVSGDNR
jgi:hypothetical protein